MGQSAPSATKWVITCVIFVSVRNLKRILSVVVCIFCVPQRYLYVFSAVFVYLKVMPRSNLKMEDYYDDEQLTREKKKLWPIGFTYLSILSDTIIALVAKVKPLEGKKLKMGSVCEEEGSRVA